MPDGLRPALLADRYPRLVNRLALSWTDATLAEMLLADLLQDRRGGRKGFAPEIRAELTRLAVDVRKRETVARRRKGAGAGTAPTFGPTPGGAPTGT